MKYVSAKQSIAFPCLWKWITWSRLMSVPNITNRIYEFELKSIGCIQLDVSMMKFHHEVYMLLQTLKFVISMSNLLKLNIPISCKTFFLQLNRVKCHVNQWTKEFDLSTPYKYIFSFWKSSLITLQRLIII